MNKYARVADLKKDPSKYLDLQETVAILQKNRAVAYLVPSAIYSEMMEKLEHFEHLELALMAEQRMAQEMPFKVDYDDL